MSGYGEWCPTCGGPIVAVTRGIPSMGTCAEGHRTDRRDVLRREPEQPAMVPAAALTAAQAEIARLRAERDAAMAGRVKVKPLWWCYPCRSVGMMHCSDPEHCGCMTTADAEADSWKSWLDDLPLPDDFNPGVDRLQDFITRILAAIQPDTERAEPVVDQPVTVTYTNWRGETAQRTIIPRRVWFGSTDWHPEPQWLLTALDVEKQADRDFALKDFGAPAPQAREITVQEAARDDAYEAFMASCKIVYPSGHIQHNYTSKSAFWSGWEAALRALADMQKGCA